MLQRLTVGIALGWTLACGGVGAAELGAGADAALIAFRPGSGGCEWTRWSARTGSQVIGTTRACPTQAVFKPDGTKVVYTTDGAAHVAAWPALGEPVTIAFPDQQVMRWHPLWVASDGVLRLQATASATQTEQGDELVLTAGGISASAWKLPGGGYGYTEKGGKATPPGPDAASMLPWGEWVLDLSYEANRKGEGWTLLSALPDKLAPDVGFTPHVGQGAWPSLAAGYTSCNSGQQCEKDEWKDRADLKALVGPDAAPGFLPAGSGGWLFGVRWGDTPHAQAPVFSCADPDCKSPVALEDLPPAERGFDTYTLQPQGDYLLVGQEQTGAHVRVYLLGRAAPVHVVDDAERAGWMPDVPLRPK